jgi:anti-anti-sigma factor
LTLLVSREKSLDTEIRQVEHHALVMLDGELDTATAAQLFEMFAELAREGIKHVALNLAELDFIDSTGISVVVAEHKRVESMGGELIIFSPRPRVRKVLEVTGLGNYLNIRPGKRDAPLGRDDPEQHGTASS